MKNSLIRLGMSEARSKLTQLHRLLKPGQVVEINKRSKPYARIELIGDIDLYESVLKSIDALPEPGEEPQPAAEHYKFLLYESNDESAKRL
jgi:hypothetical protein